MFGYIVLTAVLSTALTLGAALLFYRTILEPKLRDVLARELGGFGDMIEQRVRAGVLLALRDAASGDSLLRATRKVTRSGASLVEDGLSALLGGGRRRDDDTQS